MRNIFVLILFSITSGIVFSEEKGANLDLFPTPKADISKSTRPGKATLLEPSYQSRVTADSITLKWSSVPTATAYHLQVATDVNFKWLVANEELLNATSFEVKGLNKNQSYYWRVAAIKSDNEPTFTKGWFSQSNFDVQ